MWHRARGRKWRRRRQRRAQGALQQVRDGYAAAMDVDRLEALGAAPPKPTFDRIDAVTDTAGFAPKLLALEARIAKAHLPLVERNAPDKLIREMRGGSARGVASARRARFVPCRNPVRHPTAGP